MLPPAQGSYDNRPITARYELALLAVLVTLVTLFAGRTFPLWDDGQTMWASEHGGRQAILDSMPDRPVLANLISIVVDHGRPTWMAILAHWLAWFGVGWVTMRLWKILFPTRLGFALPAACLAVAPLLYRLQFILIISTLAAVVGPVLVWLVLLWFLSPRARQAGGTSTVAMHVVMVVVVAAAAMISEYALPTAIGGAVLLALLAPRPAKKPWQVWITVGLLLATAAVSYLIYTRLGNAKFRTDTQLGYQNWHWRLMVVGPEWLTAIWQMTLGAFIQRIGDLDFSSGKGMLVGLLAGLALACAIAWIGRRRGDSPQAEANDRRDGFVMLAMALAIAAVAFCVAVMGRVQQTWTGSRFFAPLLPVESCMAIALVSLFIHRRLWKFLPPLLGFLAGYYIVSDGLLAMREKQQIVQMGDQLEAYVPDTGLAVAFVNRAWRFPRHSGPNENDLTAKLTWNWPQEKRDHFWAFAGAGPVLHDPSEAPGNLRMTWLADPFGPEPRLFRPWQVPMGSSGSSPTAPASGERVTKFIWVSETSSGGIHVEQWPTSKNGQR